MVYKIERMVWFKVIIRVGLGCTHRRGCLAVLRLFPSTLVGCAVDIREKMQQVSEGVHFTLQECVSLINSIVPVDIVSFPRGGIYMTRPTSRQTVRGYLGVLRFLPRCLIGCAVDVWRSSRRMSVGFMMVSRCVEVWVSECESQVMSVRGCLNLRVMSVLVKGEIPVDIERVAGSRIYMTRPTSRQTIGLSGPHSLLFRHKPS